MTELYRQWGRKVLSLSELALLPPEAVLARCLWGEARGAQLHEKQKVGAVIRNRVRWWIPKPVGAAAWAKVILQPYQFSWTLANDPNLPKVLDPIRFEPEAVWEVCCRVAEGIVRGGLADDTLGADHYYDRSMDAKPPSWAAQLTPTIQTERFRFFRSPRVRLA